MILIDGDEVRWSRQEERSDYSFRLLNGNSTTCGKIRYVLNSYQCPKIKRLGFPLEEECVFEPFSSLRFSVLFQNWLPQQMKRGCSPTLNRTQIVFAYGGYLWSVPREGGDARQLTTGGHEGQPVFSPDGNFIAFTGQYDGNIDAYVMPAQGGEPRRLT